MLLHTIYLLLKGEKAMDILLSIWFGEKVKKQWIYFYLSPH